MADETPTTGHRMTHEDARDDALGAMLGWLPGYTEPRDGGDFERPQYKVILVEETLNGGIFRWEPANTYDAEQFYAEPEGATFRLYVFAERVPPEGTS